MENPTIVIADDEPGIRDCVADVLEDVGYTVIVVADGLSALAAIRARRPALAILDVAMPVMTGDATLRALREEGPHVPVIIMTAGLNPCRFLQEGAAAALAKPFELAELLAAVDTALSPPKHSAHRAWPPEEQLMNAERWYELARHDRPRALRFLLLHDAAGLRQFAEVCADYLAQRHGVPLRAADVQAVWRRVGLWDEGQMASAGAERQRAVGE